MSRYWIITRETESLLVFNDVQNLVIFLYDHRSELTRFRILKNKEDYVVEIHLAHLEYKMYREILEQS